MIIKVFIHIWNLSYWLFLFDIFQKNLELFKADGNADTWKAYVDYVDEMIVDGFFNTIHCSLKFLLDQTDNKNNPNPLFEAHLELQVPEMVFLPSLDYGVADGFYDLVDGLVGDVYKQASLIRRLAAHSGQEHYQPDLEDMEELSEMRQELMDRIQNIMNKACEYRNTFDNYSYLWVDDRNEFMRQFLLYNHVLTTEEIEAHAEDGVPECPPTLNQFKEQINTYEKIYDEAEKIEPLTIFEHWFRVNSKPFKQALLNTIKRWSFMFKQHLIDHVTNRYEKFKFYVELFFLLEFWQFGNWQTNFLNVALFDSLKELAEFIKTTDSGLMKPVEEGDYNGLVDCMGYLFAVKDRQATTDEMFEPLKQTIELLKTYEQELPEEVHQQLQVTKLGWK